MDNENVVNYRSSVPAEPSLMPLGGGESVMRTPFVGNVRAMPPPLPQAPTMQMQYGNTGYSSSGYGGGYGSYGSFGSSFGNSFGGYGGFGGGYGGYGGGYGGAGAFNRFGGGMNPMDPEARFIQMAEDSSRPAFQSIESLVSAIGNIASMLDSTFFALTSSFRAILGVAANFGRLRGVFAQFWQTFAIFRGLNWIYRKMLYWLRISNLDPSSTAFKKAFAEAINESSPNGSHPGPKLPRKGQSPWPVLAFLSFIFTAPYLIMKLLGTVTNTALEETRNPSKWINPIQTVALYDFQARNASELTIRAGDRVLIAPKEIQNTQGLLNTGWGLATIDGQLSGIIPINYVKSPQQLRQERQQATEEQKIKELLPTAQHTKPNIQPGPELMNLSTMAFPSPPTMQSSENYSTKIPEFDLAPQPIGPPNTTEIKLDENII